eukprot:3161067-Prorocentrum_lima.AAC.1
MTSSLVGSEMCIRDRSSGIASEDAERGIPQGTVSFQDSCGNDGRKNFLPVSYTHLTLPTICSV